MGAERITRDQVLAYRAWVHDLEDPAQRISDCRVLDIGVQDTPPGTTAADAFRVRLPPDAQADPSRSRALVLVHSLRGTMHVHRRRDLALLASALRVEDPRQLLRAAHGPFFSELSQHGIAVDAAFDEVAAAMRDVMSDRAVRTKGELSALVSRRVRAELTPWCGG
uniref:DNA glycosylase AlkZ-like family protein n=1 Tax=Mycobacterium hubeiense TaxID=1867256 RepID=UPI0011577331